MVEIEWHPQVPVEMRAAIEPVLNRYLWLVPRWCYQLSIEFWNTKTDENGKADSAIACIWVTDEYRRATISVYGEWFDGDEKQRRYHFVHELLHLTTAPPGDFFSRFLDNIYKEEDRQSTYLIAKQEHSRYCEQATQDLAWSIVNFEDNQPGKAGNF